MPFLFARRPVPGKNALTHTKPAAFWGCALCHLRRGQSGPSFLLLAFIFQRGRWLNMPWIVTYCGSTNAARDLAQFSARFGTPLTCASIVLAHCMQRARRKISRRSAFRLSELHAYSRYHFWASCSGTSPYSPLSDSKSQIPLFNFFARPI